MRQHSKEPCLQQSVYIHPTCGAAQPNSPPCQQRMEPNHWRCAPTCQHGRGCQHRWTAPWIHQWQMRRHFPETWFKRSKMACFSCHISGMAAISGCILMSSSTTGWILPAKVKTYRFQVTKRVGSPWACPEDVFLSGAATATGIGRPSARLRTQGAAGLNLQDLQVAVPNRIEVAGILETRDWFPLLPTPGRLCPVEIRLGHAAFELAETAAGLGATKHQGYLRHLRHW